MSTPPHPEDGRAICRFWPADLYLILYFLLLIGLVIAAPGDLPDRGNLVFEMCLVILMSLIFASGVNAGSSSWMILLRTIYPILPILYAFRLLHFLIPAVRHIDGTYERLLIHWDQLLFGTHIVYYFESIRTPVLTELMYYFYASYYVVPAVLVVYMFYRWIEGELPTNALRKLSGGITLGFISSYLLYMVVPARGPWYAMGTDAIGMNILDGSLESAWIGEQIRTVILTMEMEMYDVFPSGHTEVFLICVLLSWLYARKLFWPILVLFIGMAISTMYLRFHYGVDVIAGAVLAVGVVWFQEWIHAGFEDETRLTPG
jgi:membrane-associated phospholipid phosphatase